jgi:ERCC4-type nuclease
VRILTSQNPKDTPNILEELKAVMQILNQKQKQARVKLPNPIASLPTLVPN